MQVLNYNQLAPSSRPAVFLDRDGVLNEVIIKNGKPFPPSTPLEFKLLPGVLEACHQLHNAGLLLIVVTNQPDIARGLHTQEEINAINQLLKQLLPVDDIRVCPHDDKDLCQCRKPAPGLLLDAGKDWNIDLHRSIMVGDRWRDEAAGKNAGCATIIIDRGYLEKSPENPDKIVTSLKEAVPWIIKFTSSL